MALPFSSTYKRALLSFPVFPSTCMTSCRDMRISPAGINRVHLILSYLVLILACWLISAPLATTLQCFAHMSFLFSLYFLISLVRLWYTLKSLTRLHFPVAIGHERAAVWRLPLSPHCKEVPTSLQGVCIFPRLHAFPCSLLLPCLVNQWLNAAERSWLSAYHSP